MDDSGRGRPAAGHSADVSATFFAAFFLFFFRAFLASSSLDSRRASRSTTIGQRLHAGFEWQHFRFTLMVSFFFPTWSSCRVTVKSEDRRT
ncbi:hypothetical protein CDG81_17785 [Actinopolyspora erythraea]|uniref:Secreted protein n=1 Tax=Actinopolyspora erythraea TaxID=414996 RepID=A0A099D1I2_9ACTN|nr:hypothetical protein CDG81_17785 [Actinopolyspora erythraea]KGI79677.1 hypothetical protein IL38_22290 [Actinopolyspora erythraea]